MASISVLKYLKRKKSGRYETPVYIGAEQRFVGALRGTNNNNLEEQSILGFDCITTSYWEGTTFCEKKEFHDGTKTNEFYILESRIYNVASDSQFLNENIQFATDKIYFEQNGVLLTIESDEALFQNTESSNGTVAIPQKLGSNSASGISTIAEPLAEDDFRKTKEDILYYKNKSNTLIEVSSKVTYEKEVNGVTTTKSIVTNKL